MVPEHSDHGDAGGQLWEEVSLTHGGDKAGPSSAGAGRLLLPLPAARGRVTAGPQQRPGLTLPSSAAQAEMNIQELERRPHLWRSGQGLSEEPLVRPPVRAPQALSCPLLPAVPSPSPRLAGRRGGRQPWPSCTGHGSAWALSRRPFGAGHTVGFLTNWLPGGRAERDSGCGESQAEANGGDSLDDLSRAVPSSSPATRGTGVCKAAFWLRRTSQRRLKENRSNRPAGCPLDGACKKCLASVSLCLCNRSAPLCM